MRDMIIINAEIASAPTLLRNDKAGCLVADSRLEHAGMTQKVEIASSPATKDQRAPRNDKVSIVGMLVLVGMMSFCNLGIGAESEDKTPSYKLAPGESWQETKEQVQGEVVLVNSSRIVLEYAQTENSAREIQLNLGSEKEIKFTRLKSLGEIYPGDVVKVHYLDRFVEDKDGKYSQYQRKVTAIALVKSATRAGILRS